MYPILIFACLFVLFGLLGLASDADAWRRFWAALSALSLGGFGISLASDALRKGQIRVQTSIIRHASQPRLFWFTVTLAMVAGVGVVIASLWHLLIAT